MADRANGLGRDVFTTGQVADLCHVAPRTVSKWFDSGRLRGYRVPGGKDRRVPRAELLRFLKAEGLPVPAWLASGDRVIALGLDAREAEAIAALGVGVTACRTPLDAGRCLALYPEAGLVASLAGLVTAGMARDVGEAGRGLVLVLPEDVAEAPEGCGGWKRLARQPIGPRALAEEVVAALAPPAPPPARVVEASAARTPPLPGAPVRWVPRPRTCVRCKAAYMPGQFRQRCCTPEGCVVKMRQALAALEAAAEGGAA